jgi:transcriptional regulator with XRE-family HTH domain
MAKGAARVVQHRLGARMQALRADRELTQEAVADRIGISQKYLSELERGRKTPSWATLLEIAHDGFNVRLSALLFGIDEEVGNDVHTVEELLAGRPPEVRRAVLRAIQGILAATDAQAAGTQAAPDAIH